MLRFIPRRLAVGAYTLFMMEQKNNPKLKGLAIADRGKMTSTLYKSLSAADKAALEKRAAAHATLKRAPRTKKDKKKRAPREASPYTEFVKANIGKFVALPQRDRMKAVAKLWNQKQQT